MCVHQPENRNQKIIVWVITEDPLGAVYQNLNDTYVQGCQKPEKTEQDWQNASVV